MITRRLFALLLALVPAPAAAQTWAEITPVSGDMPEARAHASAVYDSQQHRMIVFGGHTGPSFLKDVWAFDLSSHTWTELTPDTGTTPPARRTPGSTYDPFNHQMITWSGQSGGSFFNDVWAFDLTTNQWSEFLPPPATPNIRYGVAAVFDPVARDLVTFAGFTNMGRFDDTWRFNEAAVTWTDVSPVTSPLERCLHAACYDSGEHRMIMYGGQNSGALDDIWALDLSTDTWTDITPASRPDGRYFATVVYDVSNHRVTVFAGTTNSGRTNEVWLFDLFTEQWQQMLPAGGPPSSRAGSAGVYVPGEDRMVTFGGFSGSHQNDVWSLGGLSGTVTSETDDTAPAPALHQNHPNPFNPSTMITYQLAEAGHVRLRVYNPLGQVVRTLIDGELSAGARTVVWDGRDDRGNAVSSGVYLYKLVTRGHAETRKMTLLK